LGWACAGNVPEATVDRRLHKSANPYFPVRWLTEINILTILSPGCATSGVCDRIGVTRQPVTTARATTAANVPRRINWYRAINRVFIGWDGQ
jgi:hypothetical protein